MKTRILLPLFLHLAVPAKAQVIKRDKAGHFAVGFTIAFGGAATKHPKLGLALGIGWGIGKEIADHQANIKARRLGLPLPHAVEQADIGATVLGAAAGFLLGSWLFRPRKRADMLPVQPESPWAKAEREASEAAPLSDATILTPAFAE